MCVGIVLRSLLADIFGSDGEKKHVDKLRKTFPLQSNSNVLTCIMCVKLANSLLKQQINRVMTY